MTQPEVKPTTLLKNIETLGKRFRAEHLAGWQPKGLEADWFSALHFLFERNFMRGRRDELSNVYLSFTMDRLRSLLRPSDDLDTAYRTLTEHHALGQLDSGVIVAFKKRHGLKGTANAIAHKAFDTEIAATNPLAKLLTTECEVTVTWPKEYRKVARLSNEKDLLMVMDTLSLICQPGCQNVYHLLMQQIRESGTRAAYNTLNDLSSVGDKLASMTIRDLGMMHPGLIKDDFDDVFPVDTWVRKTAGLLGCTSSVDSEIKDYFRRECEACGVDAMLFAAGMWYLGANALDVLIGDFVGAFDISESAT